MVSVNRTHLSGPWLLNGKDSAYPVALDFLSGLSIQRMGLTPKNGKVAEPGFNGVAPGRE